MQNDKMNYNKNEYHQMMPEQANLMNSEKILEDKYLDGSLEFSPFGNNCDIEGNHYNQINQNLINSQSK